MTTIAEQANDVKAAAASRLPAVVAGRYRPGRNSVGGERACCADAEDARVRRQRHVDGQLALFRNPRADAILGDEEGDRRRVCLVLFSRLQTHRSHPHSC